MGFPGRGANVVLRVKVPRKPLYSSLGLEPSYCGILAQDAPGSTDATKGLGNRGEAFGRAFWLRSIILHI